MNLTPNEKLLFKALNIRKPEAVIILLENNAETLLKNTVNRTAAEMASFIGYHYLANLIKNYITLQSIEKTIGKLYSSKRLVVDKRISSHLFRDLQMYINLQNIHPFKFIFHIHRHPQLLQNYLTVMSVLTEFIKNSEDLDKEDELKSFKCHYALFIINKIMTNAFNHGNIDLVNHETFGNNTETINIHLQRFIKSVIHTIRCKPETHYVERLLREMIKNYPHKDSAIFRTLLYEIHKIPLGDNPTSHSILQNVLFYSVNEGETVNHNHVELDASCVVCSELKNTKICKNCNQIYYCSVYCQKLDWPFHKKTCLV
ncbi:ankyrin repeat and MYND domain-containing protein 2-like isoform X2 [Gordionus sp. m RMFG-2023]|uniref:ankyrin repeat and MYND domain-containing protein 2-like isoform X2 n=1 Tax=Gordionus sp. m RMFG-2023 TaxID=3053472 RepID=UPI0031FC7AF2